MTKANENLGKYWGYQPLTKFHLDQEHDWRKRVLLRKQLKEEQKKIRKAGLLSINYGYANMVLADRVAKDIEKRTGVAMVLVRHDYL